MSQVIQVITTTATDSEARNIARTLVERRLAACVQIVGPIESVYRWEGKIESAAEWQCWIKTQTKHFAAVEAAIVELHSYELPEILALPANGNERYSEWLCKETDAE